MKKLAVLFIGLLAAFSQIHAQGIEFDHLTWKEALQKAKSEQKLIFVDAYASWCGPCKWMAKNSFPDASVGEYHNKYFVNLKIDMESDAAAEFARSYRIAAYPTLMYIDGDGKVVQKIEGAMEASELLKAGKTAVYKYGKEPLKNHPKPIPNPNKGGDNQQIVYASEEGRFVYNGNNIWIEQELDGSIYASFREYDRDATYIYIVDDETDEQIAIPLEGGMAYFSDAGDDWESLFNVEKRHISKNNGSNSNGSGRRGSIGGR